MNIQDAIKVVVTFVLPDYEGHIDWQHSKTAMSKQVNIFSDQSFMTSQLSNKDTPRVEELKE